MGRRGARYLPLSNEKPGYYLSEQDFVTDLRQELSLEEYHRFPLTYIMEAADDISYCVADLEDAVEKEILTTEQFYLYLRQTWGTVDPSDLFVKTVEQAYESRKRHRWRSTDDQFFMQLRINTMAKLVPYATHRFIKNLPAIYAGAFDEALLEDKGAQVKLLRVFKEVARKYVFNNAEVEKLELQGYRVIGGYWTSIICCWKCLMTRSAKW